MTILRMIVTCAFLLAVFAGVTPAWADTDAPSDQELSDTSVPPAAAPPTGPPQAVFYELTENMKVKGNKVMSKRIATAALAGSTTLGTPFCPEDLAFAVNPAAGECDLTALGRDNVSLTTALGRFSATISVVVHGDNAVDGPEFVIDKIKVGGPIDFTPAFSGLPYGTVKGHITGRQSGKPGANFIGVFRQPFDGAADFFGSGATYRQVLCGPSSTPNDLGGRDFAYYDTTPTGTPLGTCTNIELEELSLNTPLVRFEIWFQ
jgi:hypothetical protein